MRSGRTCSARETVSGSEASSNIPGELRKAVCIPEPLGLGKRFALGDADFLQGVDSLRLSYREVVNSLRFLPADFLAYVGDGVPVFGANLKISADVPQHSSFEFAVSSAEQIVDM